MSGTCVPCCVRLYSDPMRRRSAWRVSRVRICRMLGEETSPPRTQVYMCGVCRVGRCIRVRLYIATATRATFRGDERATYGYVGSPGREIAISPAPAGKTSRSIADI